MILGENLGVILQGRLWQRKHGQFRGDIGSSIADI